MDLGSVCCGGRAHGTSSSTIEHSAMASPAKLRSPPPSTPTRIDPAQQKMAVVSSNEDGIIQSVNGYACALFGYDKESMIGKNVNSTCWALNKEIKQGVLPLPCIIS